MERTDTTTSIIASNDREDLVEAVVSEVAEAEGVPPLELPPLAAAIDPDALENLVASMSDSPTEFTGIVRFPYDGYAVTVDGGGRVAVSERRN